MELTPISETEFRKKLKGCGVKYYSKIPKTELKALEIKRFCTIRKLKRNFEISDDWFFSDLWKSD